MFCLRYLPSSTSIFIIPYIRYILLYILYIIPSLLAYTKILVYQLTFSRKLVKIVSTIPKAIGKWLKISEEYCYEEKNNQVSRNLGPATSPRSIILFTNCFNFQPDGIRE